MKTRNIAGLYLRDDGWSFVELEQRADELQVKKTYEDLWRSTQLGERAIQLSIFREHNRLTSHVIVAFDEPDAIWNQVEFPALSGHDLDLAVKATVGEWGISGDSISVYQIMENAEKLKVRIGAVGRRIVDYWVNLLEQAGFTPAGFVLAAQALVEAKIKQKTAAFIHHGASWITLGVADKGMLAFVRSIPNSNEQPASDSQDDLVQEIRMTRYAWNLQGGTMPSSLHLVGVPLELDPELLAVAWGIDSKEVFSGSKVFQDNASLCVAYGAALLGNSPDLSLIWRPYLPVARRRERRNLIWTFAAAAIFLIAGSMLHIIARQNRGNRQRSIIQEHLPLYSELKQIEEKDEQTSLQISTYKDLWSKRRHYTEFFYRWHAKVPEGTLITGITLEGNRLLELSGRTPSFVTLFIKLEESCIFKELELKGAIIHNPKGWDEFRLVGVLSEGVLDGEIRTPK
jgi:hypothetical protein